MTEMCWMVIKTEGYSKAVILTRIMAVLQLCVNLNSLLVFWYETALGVTYSMEKAVKHTIFFPTGGCQKLLLLPNHSLWVQKNTILWNHVLVLRKGVGLIQSELRGGETPPAPAVTSHAHWQSAHSLTEPSPRYDWAAISNHYSSDL